MTISKKDLCKAINAKTSVPNKDSEKLLNRFIFLIKEKSKNKKIKLNRFGTFKYVDTKKRIGRNPQTKEEFIIVPSKRLNFIASSQLKKLIN
tara:strand:+ start:63 stop:338 length:276 start_codon:yes stop_codon:yes gene_type:complete